MLRSRVLGRWLHSSSDAAFSAYAIAAAFSMYFCMYAIRKPFTAGIYEEHEFWDHDLDLKVVLIISQVIGYALSKFIGIKVCSEATPGRRAAMLVVLILWGEAALVLFGWVPGYLKVAAIFLNGIPLGMVWGLVFSFLEGRRTSDLLGAGLSCSYIVASGVVKAVGRAFLDMGIPEFWMPALTGLCFLPPFLISVWLLDQVPAPTEEDVKARTRREPMDARQRFAFMRSFLLGVVILIVCYFFLTAYRDFRDNFMVNILSGMNLDEPWIMAVTEIPIAVLVMVAMAFLYLVKDNRRGLIAVHVLMAVGTLSIAVSTILYDLGLIKVWWIILTGLGAYLAYVPFGCVLFDRIIASTRVVGTAVFAIYVADALGYTGSISIMLYAEFAKEGTATESVTGHLVFFRGFSYFTAILCTVCFVASCFYFVRRGRRAATE